MARQLGGDRAHLNESAIERRRLDQPASTQYCFLDALERREDREDRVGIFGDFSDAPGRDQPLSMKRLNLLSARVVAFHFELPFEKPRGYRVAEKADADDADSLHGNFTLKKFSPAVPRGEDGCRGNPCGCPLASRSMTSKKISCQRNSSLKTSQAEILTFNLVV